MHIAQYFDFAVVAADMASCRFLLAACLELVSSRVVAKYWFMMEFIIFMTQ